MSKSGNTNNHTSGSGLPQDFISHLSRCIDAHNSNPQDNTVEDELQRSRRLIAKTLLSLDIESLHAHYADTYRKAPQLLLGSNFLDIRLNHEDENISRELVQHLKQEYQTRDVVKYLIAAALYIPAEKMPEEILDITMPDWFLEDFVIYLLRPKFFFSIKSDVDAYRKFISRVVEHLHEKVFPDGEINMPDPDSPRCNLAALATRHMYFIPLYFGNCDLKDIMEKRAELIEASQPRADDGNGAMPIHHPGSHDRIRLGILCSHLNPQTETYATLPVYEHIDRNKFEIILYGGELRGHPLERYCQSRSDRLVQLPGELNEQLRLIRGDSLDILFTGSNVTAVSNPVCRIAAHRVAPLQVTSICSPATTGMKNIDYYIAGNLTVAEQTDSAHYTEQLVTIDGSGLCFSFAEENNTPSARPDRARMGIPEDTVLFVTGANFFKIIPELRDAWMQIIASVPGSLLLLYPFNPYWSRSYKAGLLLQSMLELCEQLGISKERLVFLNPFQSRADIKAFLEICDVYLDAFPYGGATSIIDPLQTNLPPVVVEGNYLRFRQASAMLTELGIPELITDSGEDYIKRAIELGNNRDMRQGLRDEISEKMSNCPAFLDSKKYAASIGNLLESLHMKSPTG